MALQLPLDPKVYLAAQPDVSVLNRQTRDAMEAAGQRLPGGRASFTGTMMAGAELVGADPPGGGGGVVTLRVSPEDASTLAAGRVAPGDVVRVLRAPVTWPLDGVVLEVSPERGTLRLRCARWSPSRPGTPHTLMGLLLYDPERTAQAARARNLASNGGADPTDAADTCVPGPEVFDPAMYRALFPLSAAAELSFSDTYLDCRQRQRRDEAAGAKAGQGRATQGDMVVSLSAALVSFPVVAATDLLVAGRGALVVSPSNLVAWGGRAEFDAGGNLALGGCLHARSFAGLATGHDDPRVDVPPSAAALSNAHGRLLAGLVLTPRGAGAYLMGSNLALGAVATDATLGVAGCVAVGSGPGYAGAGGGPPPPRDGLVVQGAVGIGTSRPMAGVALDVHGSARVTSDLSVAGDLRVQGCLRVEGVVYTGTDLLIGGAPPPEGQAQLVPSWADDLRLRCEALEARCGALEAGLRAAAPG